MGQQSSSDKIIYTYIRMHVYIHANDHMLDDWQTKFLYMYIYINIHTYIQTNALSHIHTLIHLHTQTYTYTHTHLQPHTYAYTHTLTHLHTHTHNTDTYMHTHLHLHTRTPTGVPHIPSLRNGLRPAQDGFILVNLDLAGDMELAPLHMPMAIFTRYCAI